MCTSGKDILASAEVKFDIVFSELRRTKNELGQAKKEKEVAELEIYNTKQRNMCLTRNADIANFWMMLGTATSFILLGLVVYGL